MGGAAVPVPYNIIRGTCLVFSGAAQCKGRDKVFVLSASDHDLIMSKGTLSV